VTVNVTVADKQVANTLREITATTHLAIRAFIVCNQAPQAAYNSELISLRILPPGNGGDKIM